MTHRDRILQALTDARKPLDDDELSRRTGIEPRQAVNQAARRLESDGFLRRLQGDNGKIVNILTAWTAPGAAEGLSPPASVARLDDGTRPPGNSAEQRKAERIMLDLLQEDLGVRLAPGRIDLPDGERVEIDGTDEARTVLVECWAHQGTPKAAQRHKVLADAFKLNWIAATIYPRPRLILCLSDPAAAAPFLPGGKSWASRAFADLGIKVEVVTLPPALKDELVEAQRRQYR